MLAFISSVLVPRPLPSDLPLHPSHPDFRETGLKVPSIVMCDKIVTVERRIILGELGQLSATHLREPGPGHLVARRPQFSRSPRGAVKTKVTIALP